jgi:DNA-binding response OmpR family regulator
MNNDPMPPALEPAAAPLQFQTSPPHRILVVEDDVLIRQLNTRALSLSGYAVDVAEDGAAAWEALRAGSYDLMITDNTMPKMSGVELLKKMRAARMVLPVIMATGVLPKAEFTRYPWLQPEATLVKPYTVEEMVHTVKKVLREADSTADSSQRFMYQAMQNGQSPPAGARPGPARQWPADSPHRILVVEEDGDLRRLYAEALAGPGYHVDAVEDGIAAWEALQTNRYHLLITENELPNLSGIQLVEKARAAWMTLPVVMAATRLPTDELARNQSLQFAATLVKPFAVDALLETVENILRATVGPPELIAPAPDGQSQPSADGVQL